MVSLKLVQFDVMLTNNNAQVNILGNVKYI